MIKPIRTKLPKYQKDIYQLPQLTQLLTDGKSLKGLNELRIEKLAVYKSYLPADQNCTLLEALFHQNNNIDQLLQVIDANLETMNSFYVAVSFEVLDDMMRSKSCDVATVIVSPEFKRLCTRTLYKIRFFESDELIKIIKCLSSVQLLENSLLTQAALQMSRHMINDFDEGELEALSQALENMKVQEQPRKSLIEAVKKAQQLLHRKRID